MAGAGLRVRFSAIKGVTPRGVLTKPLYLPCLLGDFSLSEEFGHTDYTTAEGEFSQPEIGGAKARRLRGASFDTLTLDWHASWFTAPRFSTPEQIRRELSDLGRAKRPFAILVLTTDRRDELRMKSTLRSMPRTLRPGEADTRYLTLEIREWRDNRLGRRRASRPTDGELPRTIVLTKKDTLHSLAAKYGASARQWRPIARANGLTKWPPSKPIVDSKAFKVGDKFTIPPRSQIGRTEERFEGLGYERGGPVERDALKAGS